MQTETRGRRSFERNRAKHHTTRIAVRESGGD